MEKLQQQIHNLDNRVEQLQGVVEHLSSQIADLSTEYHPVSQAQKAQLQIVKGINLPESVNQAATQSKIEHKDILSDEIGAKSISSQREQDIAPEIQIRRLTAQLTAAYNRIAALEEQLLASRSKSY